MTLILKILQEDPICCEWVLQEHVGQLRSSFWVGDKFLFPKLIMTQLAPECPSSSLPSLRYTGATMYIYESGSSRQILYNVSLLNISPSYKRLCVKLLVEILEVTRHCLIRKIQICPISAKTLPSCVKQGISDTQYINDNTSKNNNDHKNNKGCK